MNGRNNGARRPFPSSTPHPPPPSFDGFDPFAGFPFGGGGMFGGGMMAPGSLFASVFDGRDPFDDPFFRSPFGSLMGPPLLGGAAGFPGFMGRPSIDGVGAARGFGEPIRPEGPEERRRGPVITELDENGEEVADAAEERTGHRRKHLRSTKDPYVEEPDDDDDHWDEVEEKKSKHEQYVSLFNNAGPSSLQPHTFTFHSSTMSYGGPNGTSYSSSTTRRTGGGVTMEESKEADSTTGRATHSISRRLRDKGHTVTRKLSSDGNVDTMQMLQNLNEDELPGFDKAWNQTARHNLPGSLPQAGNNSQGSRSELQPRLLPAPQNPGHSRTRPNARNGSSRGRGR